MRRQDFVAYMTNLGLPHPKRLAAAVPANLRCGRPDDGAAPKIPEWGPVVRTFAGVLQIEPEWVHQHAAELCFVDVREQEEVDASPMGRIAGSLIIPLSSLRDRTDDVPRDSPVIVVCPAGARSAMGAQILERAGVERVANLPGGLIRWRGLGFPVDNS